MSVKLYGLNDMAKAGCNDCKGCFECCQGMGQSIVLDPYDIWQIECGLNCTFAELLQEKELIELNIEDGLILPNLKMQGAMEKCGFLNGEGRCSIHAYRPGLCRLFPLGRNYENHNLQYFLLEDACTNSTSAKVKIKKWLDIPDSRRYEEFLINWHDLRRILKEKIADLKIDVKAGLSDMDIMKEINMKFLHIFYETQYLADDFYRQFDERTALFSSMTAEVVGIIK
ncbi:MAG: YkgJ family cysteine cluster protein [Lachnospiraceae bacterium]|nr:YkgJ family cysteine cluster protein [Lachnospiraceae bacterium]